MYINNLITGTMTLGSGGSSGNSKTIFTVGDGSAEEYDIVGNLSYSFMKQNGFIQQDEETGDDYFDKVVVSVYIGNTVTGIGRYVFWGCGMSSVTISDSVTSIGDWAFQSCDCLTSITIPDSVTSIGEGAFENCSELTNVTFEGKDKADVQGMTNYPFGLNNANYDGVTIHCTDGDIQVSY